MTNRINLGQLTPLDGNGDFLSDSIYRAYADLDGAAAAAFLRDNGATDVVHGDINTNGQAIGRFEGGFVVLSTNGYFSHRTGLRPGAFAWYEALCGRVVRD